MASSSQSALKSFLLGIAWLLFAIAGLSFWVGGRAIAEFTKTPRGLAEMEGIGLAVVCGALGFLAKAAGEDESEDSDT